MTKARDIVTRHVEAALKEAEAEKIPADTIGRLLFEKVLHIYRAERSPEDIASELISAAENINPDEDYMFMRP